MKYCLRFFRRDGSLCRKYDFSQIDYSKITVRSESRQRWVLPVNSLQHVNNTFQRMDTFGVKLSVVQCLGWKHWVTVWRRRSEWWLGTRQPFHRTCGELWIFRDNSPSRFVLFCQLKKWKRNFTISDRKWIDSGNWFTKSDKHDDFFVGKKHEIMKDMAELSSHSHVNVILYIVDNVSSLWNHKALRISNGKTAMHHCL